MKTRMIGAMAFSAALVAALAAVPSTAMAHGAHGNNAGPAERGYGQMMGQGHGPMMRHGHGQMMGQGCGSMMGHGGMMGQGNHGGMMGQGGIAPLAEDLSVDQVRHMMEHRVAMMQNPNLKLGEVADADDDTITADVVTQDGSLVRRFMVDRHTGAMRPADMLTDKEQ
ncbi:MAG: hypothetical protein ACTSVG_14280 [Alphaproteobacteria bacterium]